MCRLTMFAGNRLSATYPLVWKSLSRLVPFNYLTCCFVRVFDECRCALSSPFPPCLIQLGCKMGCKNNNVIASAASQRFSEQLIKSISELVIYGLAIVR